MKSLVFLIICAIAASPAVAALQWSEILFNPLGNDNGKEFVELIGNESLDGCTIKDSSSADILMRNRTGTDIILIMENDSYWYNASVERNATVYMIGSAIGNGLGNTYETLSITCNMTPSNTTPNMTLNTSYNTSLIAGLTEGTSIILNGTWRTGRVNGTPGIREPTDPTANPGNGTNATNHTTTDDASNPANAAANTRGRAAVCNATLILSLNVSSGVVGDTIAMRIDSPGYAWFEALADDAPYASGDTLTTRDRNLTLPNARTMQVIVYARQCGGKQRALRTVAITPWIEPEDRGETLVAAPVRLAAAPENMTQAVDTTVSPVPAVQVTGDVVAPVAIDKDRDAVPWIAGFGIVTVVASVAVFLQLLRRGEA